jgi:hypothetical protein
MLRLAVLVVPLLAALSFATAAPALELLMFRRAGCPWCAAWDREIGPIYPKTEIGRRVPLRFVDLDRRGDAAVVLASPVRYSPTFVLVDGGREIGRIEGYPGEDFFWGRLEALVPPSGGRTSALAPVGERR